MVTETILNGEIKVCPHAKKWLDAARTVIGLSEAELVERVINGYVHSWHIQYEVSLTTPYATLARIIRQRVDGGSDDE